MDGKTIAAQLRKRREKSVEVASGKHIKFMRPPEGDFPSLVVEKDGAQSWYIGHGTVCKYVTGWDGYTEADILGASGSSDPQPFDAGLFAEIAVDDVSLTLRVGEAILDSVIEHMKSKEAVSGN